MNIKTIIGLLFLVVGMFISSTVNAAAGEAVFDSFDACDEARVAYTPVGRKKMTTGQAMILADVHPKFREGFKAGTWTGTCVRSSQVVRRVNGQAVVTSGWVYLLADFPVVKLGNSYFMQACSNPIEQIGAPRRVAAQPPTDIYADEDRVQVPPSYTPPRRQSEYQEPPRVVERIIERDVYREREPQRERRYVQAEEGCYFQNGFAQWLCIRGTKALDNYGQSCMYENGRCDGRESRRRDNRYVDNNRLPPRDRPGEPIDHGGTQWREPRQWDNNGFSRDNAREPISYNNNGQWSF